MRKLEVFSESFTETTALDVAVSRSLLEAVARGDLEQAFRLHVPAAVVAFGRADRSSDGYRSAVRAAHAHGFDGVERLAGGRAAVFHESTLAFSWATREADPRTGIRERFELISSLMAKAFRKLGIDAQVGEISGEYCPGQWSVNVGRRAKVMGVGQRLIKGAAHLGGVVVVDQSERIRDVLIPIYRSLHLDWDPRTAGALADRSPGLSNDRVAEAILHQMGKLFAVEEAQVPFEIVERARELAPQHVPRVA